MKLVEALKTGQWVKQKNELDYMAVKLQNKNVLRKRNNDGKDEAFAYLSLTELEADDWEPLESPEERCKRYEEAFRTLLELTSEGPLYNPLYKADVKDFVRKTLKEEV